MIYKPEAVVDLDTGAIVQAQVHTGEQADHKELATRVLEAQQSINRATGEKLDTLTVNSVTSDKGYYSVPELQALQQENIRTVIPSQIAGWTNWNPSKGRRCWLRVGAPKVNRVKISYAGVGCISKEALPTF